VSLSLLRLSGIASPVEVMNVSVLKTGFMSVLTWFVAGVLSAGSVGAGVANLSLSVLFDAMTVCVRGGSVEEVDFLSDACICCALLLRVKFATESNCSSLNSGGLVLDLKA
jgi:hypothetical protein